MHILDRLKQSADAWAQANDRSIATLAGKVANDGKFFDQFAGPRQNCTTKRLCDFAEFFGNPANWPDGQVPDQAQEFCKIIVGQWPLGGSSSPDTGAADIGGSDPVAVSRCGRGPGRVLPGTEAAGAGSGAGGGRSAP